MVRARRVHLLEDERDGRGTNPNPNPEQVIVNLLEDERDGRGTNPDPTLTLSLTCSKMSVMAVALTLTLP